MISKELLVSIGILLLGGCSVQSTGNGSIQISSPSIAQLVGVGPSQNNSANNESDNNAPGEQVPSIEQTSLYNIFSNHPYNTQRSFNGQYPRVVLNVIKLSSQPSLIWQMYQQDHTNPPDQCFLLSATIWENAKSSTSVAPFQQCFPGDNNKFVGIPLRGIGDWAGETGLYITLEESTGNVRTNGPIPPDHPFPQGARYDQLYGNVDVDAQNAFGAMMATVFLEMGFDWSVAQDRRVWVNKINGIE